MKRFVTGAMSISQEAHEAIAIAMNRISSQQFRARAAKIRAATKKLNGDSLQRSATKQVASGRFGVTSEYMVTPRTADQDRPGREARQRQWSTSGPQGERNRARASFDSGRHPHQPSAAPRYLFH